MASKNNKNEKRKISLRNYIISIIIFIGVILLTFYIFRWYQVFNNEKITHSYLISSHVISNEINSIDELEDIFSEAPDEYFLYISYTNDKNIYDMEVDLKKVIKKYDLQDKFYYLNIDDIKNNESMLSDLNSALGLNKEKIKNVPSILYFKDHKLVDGGIIQKDNNSILQASDLEQFLEEMEIEKP